MNGCDIWDTLSRFTRRVYNLWLEIYSNVYIYLISSLDSCFLDLTFSCVHRPDGSRTTAMILRTRLQSLLKLLYPPSSFCTFKKPNMTTKPAQRSANTPNIYLNKTRTRLSPTLLGSCLSSISADGLLLRFGGCGVRCDWDETDVDEGGGGWGRSQVSSAQRWRTMSSALPSMMICDH